MRGWSLWQLRGALVRTRVASRRAARTTSGCAASSRQARRSAVNAFLIGIGLGALILVCVSAYVSIAWGAEEGGLPGTGEAAKRLALDSGQWGTLLALALGAVVAEFGVIMRLVGNAGKTSEKNKGEVAATALEHAKELAEREEAFAKERAEWQAGTTLLQEQRLGQLREVMTALNNASNVMSALQNSVNERSQTSAELASQVQSMVSAIQSLRSTYTDELSALRKKINEALEENEALAKRRGGP